MDQNHTSEKVNCLNCNASIQGNFCSNCGQSTAIGRISFKETFKNFLSSTFALDGPLLFTILNLIRNPGVVFREFINGKRKTYYQPVQFFVLITFIYIIVRALLHFDPLEGKFDGFSEDPNDAMNLHKEAAKFMVSNINNIMLFLVISMAALMKIFFWKKYNLAEFTSVGFFITGLYILFGIVMMIIQKFTGMNSSNFQLIILMLVISYCTASLIGKITFLSIIKYLLVGILCLILYLILGYGFSLIVVSFR